MRINPTRALIAIGAMLVTLIISYADGTKIVWALLASYAIGLVAGLFYDALSQGKR